MLDSFLKLKLNLLHLGHITLGSEWQFEGVISPFSRLYLVTKGEAWVWHHQQKFHLQPGYLYLIPSFTLSRYYCNTTMTQYYISFLEETESGPSVFDLLPFCYEVPVLSFDKKLFKRLLELNPGRSLQNIDPKVYDNQSNLLSFNRTPQDQSASQQMETQGILLQLLSRFLQNTSETTSKQAQAHIQLRPVLNYIHAHLHEKITVEQLAALQRLNVDYFSRQFQNQLGIRPIHYITNKRLERAQLLITSSSLSLQEIAEQVGVADIYYFSRLFKRRFGLPPARYRKNNGQV
ncbi:helix-turn-helix domain-containing protein [Adhaeribacter radiodurans]|uniref:Helix-turn-helix transcriptional regulator n=1 Tax=Adhaeribacter radiodurans TaxID=2745197 RepID=A0A7L7L1G4_9BACT|nr:AraC family transcriptional regulator [Adhaeribacter radiodurans]QMU26632.1 helix-turn-helix transcriptional regulator [Adhaeribacter radiodurans]